ncbi:MAG: ABC transporter ATP-binding protein, partial [Candidatus Brocadiia bacterium]
MSFLAIRDLSKSFGERPVADRISLSIGKGEIIVVLGPSGCGKTTLLRMISGLETPDAGTIELEGRNILPVPPHMRDIAMVFQNYALYPHMTARENIGFALKMAGVPNEPRSEAVARTSAMLGITGLLDKYPAQCSGGERQRIALGRAVIRNPRLFLFDEPLSNLDAGLRERLRIELRTTLKKLRATALYVTHDQAEAMALADRVAIIIDGRIVQTAPPREIYERPATTFVASFIGRPEINRFPGNARDGVFDADAAFSIPCPASVVGRVELLLRPESLSNTP